MALSDATRDLTDIVAAVRRPQAWRYNRGEGALVAVVESEGDHADMVQSILAAGAPGCRIVRMAPPPHPHPHADSTVLAAEATLAVLEQLAALAREQGQLVIANLSWEVSLDDLALPCSNQVASLVRQLSQEGLVLTCWAAGNSGPAPSSTALAGFCCTNSTPWSVSVGALDRRGRPQPYSSALGRCSPLHPTVSAPTYGMVPYGGAYQDMGETGGYTSACVPLVSAALAIMMTQWPGWRCQDYRAALRASAKPVGLPRPLTHPAAGWGLLQADRAVAAVPLARAHPSWLLEGLVLAPLSGVGPPAR